MEIRFEAKFSCDPHQWRGKSCFHWVLWLCAISDIPFHFCVLAGCDWTPSCAAGQSDGPEASLKEGTTIPGQDNADVEHHSLGEHQYSPGQS